MGSMIEHLLLWVWFESNGRLQRHKLVSYTHSKSNSTTLQHICSFSQSAKGFNFEWSLQEQTQQLKCICRLCQTCIAALHFCSSSVIVFHSWEMKHPAMTCFPKFYQDVKLIVKHCFEFSGVKDLGS